MNQQPKPEAVEAVAKAIYERFPDGTMEWPSVSWDEDGEGGMWREMAEAGVTAYTAHQQHALDTIRTWDATHPTNEGANDIDVAAMLIEMAMDLGHQGDESIAELLQDALDHARNNTMIGEDDDWHSVHARLRNREAARARNHHRGGMRVMTDDDAFTVFRAAYKDAARNPRMDTVFDNDFELAVALCDRAGAIAVRDAVFAGLIVEEGDDLGDWLRPDSADQEMDNAAEECWDFWDWLLEEGYLVPEHDMEIDAREEV